MNWPYLVSTFIAEYNIPYNMTAVDAKYFKKVRTKRRMMTKGNYEHKTYADTRLFCNKRGRSNNSLQCENYSEMKSKNFD